MQLTDWLNRNDLTVSQFAARLGEHQEVVRRYCLPAGSKAKRIPRRDPAIKIYVITEGAVSPNDFYELPALTAAEAAQ